MKKLFLLITTCLFVIISSINLHAGPMLSITQGVYDFGTVPEGTIIKHSFIIKNNGDEPLLVQSVNTG